MKARDSYLHTDILGMRVDAVTIDESLQIISQQIDRGTGAKSFVVIKPYVEFAMQSKANPTVEALLNRADLSVADGVSLQWAASYLYGKPASKPTVLKLGRSLLGWIQRANWREQILPEKFAGITHTLRLFDQAEQKAWRIGVIGGLNPPAVITKELLQRWPKLQLGGVWSGFNHVSRSMDFSAWQDDTAFSATIGQIKQQKLDILCVGMGFPRQEMFMDAMRDQGLAKVLIGEGGSFDYQEMGGAIRRAPVWMRKLGLEWLWRLLRQPSRILRQLAIPRFILAVHRQARQNWSKKG